MIAPEVLDALLKAGATAEMIVAAVKADSASEDARKARKREGNATRQRRYREAHAESNGSNALRSVTLVSNSDRPSPLSPPLKNPPDPLKITPPLTPQPDVSVGTDAPPTKAEIVEAWQQRMVPLGFPAIAKMTGQRERQLRARIRDSTFDEWSRAMDALERSAFCRGENDRGWRADFDFLLQPKSFTKLLEGAYDQ